MEFLDKELLHHRLRDEIDTFIETGYCTYWNTEPYSKFIKPEVKEENMKWYFKRNYLYGNYYELLSRELKSNRIIVYYNSSNKKYVYQHLENDKLYLDLESNDYMEIHKLIIYEMENYKNIILSY